MEIKKIFYKVTISQKGKTLAFLLIESNDPDLKVMPQYPVDVKTYVEKQDQR